MTIEVDKIIFPDGSELESGLSLIGSRGEAGTNGTNGTNGDKGDKGDKGDRGIGGIRGIRGVDGPRGLPGTNGTNGANGDDGEDGTPADTTKLAELQAAIQELNAKFNHHVYLHENGDQTHGDQTNPEETYIALGDMFPNSEYLPPGWTFMGI